MTTTQPREVGMLFNAPLVRAIKNTSIGSRPVKPVDPTLPIKCVTRRLKNRLNVKAGDILYVRETIYVAERSKSDKLADMSNHPFCYAADGYKPTRQWRGFYGWRTASSMNMPKWAARLWLKVIGVIRLPLRETNEADAVMEGFETLGDFVQAWDGLAPVGARWFDNPTVWVIEFERIKREASQ